MVRVALLALALALGAPAAAAAAGTELKITFWPEGQGHGASSAWTLRCAPPGGTLPRADAACDRLGASRNPFAPIPKNQVCTEIYGGPQEAIVAGRYQGRRIWIRLRRTNGCEIARFYGLRFLVPAALGSGGPP